MYTVSILVGNTFTVFIQPGQNLNILLQCAYSKDSTQTYFIVILQSVTQLEILLKYVLCQGCSWTYLFSVCIVRQVIRNTVKVCVQSARQFEILLQCINSQDSNWTYLQIMLTVTIVIGYNFRVYKKSGQWLNIFVECVDSQDSSQTYLQSVWTVSIVVKHICRM